MLQGLAEAGGLSFMELARLPVLALELGQFVHGPFETLRPSSGLVLLRGAGAAGEGVARVTDVGAPGIRGKPRVRRTRPDCAALFT